MEFASSYIRTASRLSLAAWAWLALGVVCAVARNHLDFPISPYWLVPYIAIGLLILWITSRYEKALVCPECNRKLFHDAERAVYEKRHHFHCPDCGYRCGVGEEHRNQ